MATAEEIITADFTDFTDENGQALWGIHSPGYLLSVNPSGPRKNGQISRKDPSEKRQEGVRERKGELPEAEVRQKRCNFHSSAAIASSTGSGAWQTLRSRGKGPFGGLCVGGGLGLVLGPVTPGTNAEIRGFLMILGVTKGVTNRNSRRNKSTRTNNPTHKLAQALQATGLMSFRAVTI
jgi:hypothetical protein